MKDQWKKVFAATLLLFAIFLIMQPTVSPVFAASSSQVTTIFSKVTDKIDAITEGLTTGVARSVFGIFLAGCLVLGLTGRIPKKPAIIGAICASGMSVISEITQLFFP